MKRVMPGREEYLKLFRDLPFQPIADTPTVRYYTDWKVYEELLEEPDAERPDPVPDFLEALLHDASLVLDTRVDVRPLPSGVTISTLDPEDLMFDGRRAFSLARIATKMQAYHAYRWKVGAALKIEQGVDFGRIVVFSGSGTGYTGHHLLVDIGDGARGEIVFVDYAGQGRGLKTLVIEGWIGARSEVKVTTLVYHHRDKAVYSIRSLEVGEEAKVDSRLFTAGGKMTRFQDDNIIKGRRAWFDGKASNVARPGTKSDVIFSTLHYGPESEGIVRARGIVIGNGYLAQRGAAILYEEARLAASEVESYVTLLSEKGKGYAVPVLEIHTGEVSRAGHSAAVASLGEEFTFYLKSRGLTEKELVALLIEGIGGFSGVTESLDLPLYRIVES